MRDRLPSAVLVAAALAIGLLLAKTTGVTYDEPPYLAFSWAYLHGGPKAAVREYPPVLSYLRGAVLAAAGAGAPSPPADLVSGPIEPQVFGQLFLFYNRVPPETLLFWGRAAGLLLFAVLLIVLRLWGGVFALAFAAFDPNLLAHSSLATTDGGFTALFIASLALWELSPAAAGAVGGLALASKATGLILPLIFLFAGRARLKSVLIACASPPRPCARRRAPASSERGPRGHNPARSFCYPDERMKVSILVPVYNERYLIGECLKRVVAAPLPQGVECEIIVVDDGSTDGSERIIREAAQAHPGLIKVIRHAKNSGKGAAVKTAIGAAGGDVVLIQDGDLEYDPSDYPSLLEPILSGRADAVFGSRFSGDRRRVLNFWHTMGNRALTVASNMFTGLDLTDMWTCYKVILTPFVKNMPLRCKGFCVEPELISKLAKRRCRIYEVPISYHGRDYDEGKKIGVRDAVLSLAVIVLFWLYDDLYGDDRWGRRMLRQLDMATRFNGWVADAVRGSLGDTVLEIGGGIGNLTAKLCRRDTYYVTDTDPLDCLHLERRFAGRPGVKVLKVDVTVPADFRTLRSKVDTVLCLNVLEHVEDDLAALKNLRSSLRPGGRLVLLVPNLPWAYGSIDELAGYRRRYERSQLAALLHDAGLTVESITDFNRVSLPMWVWNGRVLKRRSIGRVQLKLFDHFVWLFRRIDRFLPWPGQSLLAVARAA